MHTYGFFTILKPISRGKMKSEPFIFNHKEIDILTRVLGNKLMGEFYDDVIEEKDPKDYKILKDLQGNFEKESVRLDKIFKGKNICNKCQSLQNVNISKDEIKTCIEGLHKDYEPIEECKKFKEE